METEIVDAASADAVERAVASLCRGELVALPTETVYGLAADALSADAVVKIFEAKERPRFDPLIVHLPSADWLDRIVRVDGAARSLVDRLIAQFWPGPFTLVLPRREIVPDVVTAGLATVAVRMSSHPLFSTILREFGKPVAAPSANRFGRTSATAAQHVVEELGGRIPLVIDGGPTAHGIESTVIAIRQGKLAILRPGPVAAAELSAFAQIASESGGKIEAPGQLPLHYAPKTRLVLADDLHSFSIPARKSCGALAFATTLLPAGFAVVRRLSESADLHEAARNLFRCLRELDAAGLDLIVAESVPDEGIGTAILDRLRRASKRD